MSTYQPAVNPVGLATTESGHLTPIDDLPEPYTYRVTGRTTLTGWDHLDGDAYTVERWTLDGHHCPGHYCIPVATFPEIQRERQIDLPPEFTA